MRMNYEHTPDVEAARAAVIDLRRWSRRKGFAGHKLADLTDDEQKILRHELTGIAQRAAGAVAAAILSLRAAE